jgi:hypothetical protein
MGKVSPSKVLDSGKGMSLTVVELRKIATDRNIKLKSRLRKAEIVDILYETKPKKPSKPAVGKVGTVRRSKVPSPKKRTSSRGNVSVGGKTVTELREVAKRLGIKGYSKLRKAELEKVIAEAETPGRKTKTVHSSPKSMASKKSKKETLVMPSKKSMASLDALGFLPPTTSPKKKGTPPKASPKTSPKKKVTTPTKVVNVKVGHIRPLGYDNLKEWCADPNNVYIARKGVVFVEGQRYPKKDSVWANPYKIDSEHTRKDVIKKYEKYLKKRLKDPKDKEVTRETLMTLKGKNLGCWCKPEGNNPSSVGCHGDVIAKLIAKEEE